jgi:hypothetical protein
MLLQQNVVTTKCCYNKILLEQNVVRTKCC